MELLLLQYLLEHSEGWRAQVTTGCGVGGEGGAELRSGLSFLISVSMPVSICLYEENSRHKRLCALLMGVFVLAVVAWQNTSKRSGLK